MKRLFDVVELDIKDKVGNLKTEAHSAVKSTKYFPIYKKDGKIMIFKPLSKTKPLTTPFFAYSEVFWSYVIKKYFDERTPLYRLAICNGIDDEQPKYTSKGVLVESITPNNESLISLYDYFLTNPEYIEDIKDYVNYCMKNYDYTSILSTEFIKSNKEIGEDLSFQILLSILRQDQNFHYENINFYEENMILAPPIDFEFSTPFLYPDNLEKNKYETEKYMASLEIKDEEDVFMSFLKKRGIMTSSVLKRNVSYIVKNYPHVVAGFIDKLDCFIDNIPDMFLEDNCGYVETLNSDYWEVGHALYKEKDENKYKELKSKIELKSIKKEDVFEKIISDIEKYSKWYKSLLKKYLIAHYCGIKNLEDLTIKELLEKLNLKNANELERLDLKSLKNNRGR